ncbi:hypothetical protein ACOI1H_13525 [Loktanella sp. DJP18]|uniref:hypothetical protein n=1 Tax=Loktanella sp. DJP18 TaxID=3409788 RepID=UPI003BB59A0E
MFISPAAKISIRQMSGLIGVVASLSAIAAIGLTAASLFFMQMPVLDRFLAFGGLAVLAWASNGLLQTSQMAYHGRRYSRT